jgi:hypothetical protein
MKTHEKLKYIQDQENRSMARKFIITQWRISVWDERFRFRFNRNTVKRIYLC